MQPKVKTSAGMETASETVSRIKASLASSAGTGTPTAPAANPLLDALSSRLLQQSQGISSSSSSNLNAEIAAAMANVEQAGAATAARLQSEREREMTFAQDRASATYTTALEGRSGYATQVSALRELTETTEKSIRDLDKRYQESLLMNDAETAKQLSELRLQKLKFQQEQEQNFFSNMLGVANLQQEAISIAQQNEQFWKKMEQEQKQFQLGLEQSKYEFEKNYGLGLKEIGLKEQQLEIERGRLSLSQQEYADRKAELNEAKLMANTKALIAQDIRNKMTTEKISKDYFASTEYLALVKEKTGFDGDIEDLSALVYQAHSDVTGDKTFMDSLKDKRANVVMRGGLFGEGSYGQAAGEVIGGLGTGLSDLIFGVPSDRLSAQEKEKQRAEFYSSYFNNPLMK